MYHRNSLFAGRFLEGLRRNFYGKLRAGTFFCCLLVCFGMSSRAQNTEPPPPRVDGEWVFDAAEVQERPANSTDAYVKRRIASMEEVIANTSFVQTPLTLRFDRLPADTFDRLTITTPQQTYDAVRYDWIWDSKGFQLRLLREKEPSNPAVPDSDGRQHGAVRIQPVNPNTPPTQRPTSNQITTPQRPTQPTQQATVQRREQQEVTAVYFDVSLSGKTLTMKYRYAARANDGTYREGIFTVYMKKKK
jgi:hypothetical protein